MDALDIVVGGFAVYILAWLAGLSWLALRQPISKQLGKLSVFVRRKPVD